MRKDEVKNVIKVVRCLEQAEEGWLWFREISRRSEIHHKTVSRLFKKYLDMFVEHQSIEPFSISMVRLKSDSDLNSILKYLSVKAKIDKKAKTKPNPEASERIYS
jgi:hypothetical protein